MRVLCSWQVVIFSVCSPPWKPQYARFSIFTKFVHYHHSLKNKKFLKEKRKAKRFLYFYDYAIIQAS